MAVTKKIEIDGKEVTFKASAAVPRLYRIKFGRDIYKDLRQLEKDAERAERAARKGAEPLAPAGGPAVRVILFMLPARGRASLQGRGCHGEGPSPGPGQASRAGMALPAHDRWKRHRGPWHPPPWPELLLASHRYRAASMECRGAWGPVPKPPPTALEPEPEKSVGEAPGLFCVSITRSAA